MTSVVLDASAILAALRDEPGAAVVEQRIEGAAISAVNLAEVVGALARRGVPVETIRAAIEPMNLEVHAFDAEHAYACGNLARTTAGEGLSLGDRACLALAKSLDRPALTADRAWVSLKIGVKVIAVR